MGQQKLTIYAQHPDMPENDLPQDIPKEWKISRKLSAGERLLRNSALACAALLGLLSLRNINHPAAQSVSSVIEKAITVDFDVDDTLGELHFVRRLLPESALVFWNLSGNDALRRPVQGDITHEYSELQPWYLFATAAGDEVFATKAGSITDIQKQNGAEWQITIYHPDGSQTHYAGLSACKVRKGDNVSAGDIIAAAAGDLLYVEYCRDDEPIQAEAFY